ncbi:MAG TPA: hypothetical protein V6C88_03515 [Chroococcidiopsis sp.]
MVTSLLTVLAETGAANILQNGLNTSQGIAETWNKQWLTIFQSDLYLAINTTGVLFAAGALIFFMIKFGQQMIADGQFEQPLLSLVLPLLVIVLLANQGYVLAHGTLAMREIIHHLSNQVLSTTVLEVSLKEAIQASSDEGAVSSEISALLSQCQGMVGQKQIDCLQSANTQAQQIIGAYQTAHPGAKIGSILLNLLNQNPTIRGIEGAGQQDYPAVFGGLGYLGGFIGGVSEQIVQVVLLAFQWAFANLLEIALLLTGLIGPLAVAGLLIDDGKPFFAWVTGFFSLGMAQISYNIIVGLAAEVVVNAQVTDTLGFLVITALLAPALSLAIASGGGMAVFGVITGGSAYAASSLTRFLPSVVIPI